jgi:hypothetical protein
MTERGGVIFGCVNYAILSSPLLIHYQACVRDALRAARLNWNVDWKSQSTTKLGYAYNAVRVQFLFFYRYPVLTGTDRGRLPRAAALRGAMGCQPRRKGRVGQPQGLPELC